MKDRKEFIEKIKKLPLSPGIYRYYDNKGRILYIGKSNKLRNRVASYFNNSVKVEKIQTMLAFVDHFTYLVTDTHLEALIAEIIEIRANSPIYNSQYMKDKSLVYINVDSKGLYIDDAKGFGPFKKTRQLEELIIRIKNLYPISSFDFSYRPLISKMDSNESSYQIDFFNSILSDQTKFLKFILAIEKKMNLSANNLDFELATYYRDIHALLKSISYSLFTLPDLYSSTIYIHIPVDMRHKLFLIHAGQIINSKIVDSIDLDTLQQFKEQSNKLLNLSSDNQYTKAQRTIMDVIYSEIKSYPESWFF